MVRMTTTERRAVTLVEVPDRDRAVLIQAYPLRGGREPGNRRIAREADVFFGLIGEPALEQLAVVAPRYPVFWVSDGWQPAPEKEAGR